MQPTIWRVGLGTDIFVGIKFKNLIFVPLCPANAEGKFFITSIPSIPGVRDNKSIKGNQRFSYQSGSEAAREIGKESGFG